MAIIESIWKSIKGFVLGTPGPRRRKKRQPLRSGKKKTKSKRLPARRKTYKKIVIKSPLRSKSVTPKVNRTIQKALIKSKPSAALGKKTALSAKAASKKNAPSVDTRAQMFVGVITHYFPRISVVVVKIMEHPLGLGHVIRVAGSKTNFEQKIDSLQIESVNVKQAKKGQLVGLKVVKEAQVGDKVFRLK
jgi:hypothetical protein